MLLIIVVLLASITPGLGYYCSQVSGRAPTGLVWILLMVPHEGVHPWSEYGSNSALFFFPPSPIMWWPVVGQPIFF